MPRFGSIHVRVEQGDISAFAGDAVVNAANNHLVLGAGVAGALARRGGPAIQRECDAFVRQHGPIRVGEAAVTGGGDLPAPLVIHAAAMGDEPASRRSIREATAHSLRLAHEHQVRSVAFPILGTGVAGFPFDEATRIMLDELARHGESTTTVREVVLYGYTSDQADRIRSVLGTPRDPGSAPD